MPNPLDQSTQQSSKPTQGVGKLSELRRKKFTHYFRLWDVDHKGCMTFRDYALLTERTAALDNVPADSEIYRQMMAYTQANWDEMLRNVDTDRDGKLSLKEWLDYCSLYSTRVVDGSYTRIEELEQYTRAFFALVDQDRDGKIYAEHWHRFTKVWGIDGDPIDMFMRLDHTDKGHMTFEDLMDRFYEFILSDDETLPGNFLFGSFY